MMEVLVGLVFPAVFQAEVDRVAKLPLPYFLSLVTQSPTNKMKPAQPELKKVRSSFGGGN